MREDLALRHIRQRKLAGRNDALGADGDLLTIVIERRAKSNGGLWRKNHLGEQVRQRGSIRDHAARLGLNCPPSGLSGNGPPALRGMFAYNALIALLLAYLGAVERVGGALLGRPPACTPPWRSLAGSRLAEAGSRSTP